MKHLLGWLISNRNKQKESGMPDATSVTATAPATSGALDLKALEASFGVAVASALKPFSEKLDAFEARFAQAAAPAAPAASDTKGKALTLEDVGKLLDERLTASQQTAAAKQARDAFAGDKLKDLPAVYRNQLGNDPSKWAAEEQSIRQQYQADFKVSGAAAPANVGGTPPAAGSAPASAVNLDKLSPTALISLGLSQGSGTPSAATK
jgi:hypothetical protein